MKTKTRKRNRTLSRGLAPTIEPAKGLTLPNGTRLSRGQLFQPKEGNPMATDNGQRAAMAKAMNRTTPGATPNSAPESIARTGQAKQLPTPATTPGMRNVDGGPLAFVGGKRPLDDEPLQKTYDGKGNVPTAFGMGRPDRKDGDRLRDTHDPGLGHAVLQEAGRLGDKKA
jgi:hypothetical protein